MGAVSGEMTGGVGFISNRGACLNGSFGIKVSVDKGCLLGETMHKNPTGHPSECRQRMSSWGDHA